jgi:monovalent cation:H+ antiporter-2, CPA2 family
VDVVDSEFTLFLISGILLTSLIINTIFKRFGITPIIGYILTGAIATEVFSLKSSHLLDTAAEFGIVFLMFMIGLEFSLEKLKAMRREVFGLGLLQIIVTTILLYFVLAALGYFEPRVSFLIAVTLSLSSTAIVIKILKDTGKIRRNHGRSSVGILLMQDIAVVPILVMVSAIANKNQELSSILVTTFLNSLGGLAVIYFFGKYLVNRFLRAIADTQSNELFMMAVLFIVLAAASIASFFHIPYSMGAFIAGIIISESAYKHQIEADLVHFKDLLIGMFFLSVGILIDVKVIFESAHIIVPVALAIIFIKTAAAFTVSRVIGYTPRTSIKTALLTSQVGEFSFVIFTFAFNEHLIDHNLSQILSAIAICTMFATPFIAKYLSELSYKFASSKDDEIIQKTVGMHHHVVVVGFGNTGKSVVSQLVRMGIPYKAVEMQRDLVYDGQKKELNVIFGNATKATILDILNVKDAGAVIVTIDKHEDLMTISKTIKLNYPKVNLVARAIGPRDMDELLSAGIEQVINESGEMGQRLVEMALNCDIEKPKGASDEYII